VLAKFAHWTPARIAHRLKPRTIEMLATLSNAPCDTIGLQIFAGPHWRTQLASLDRFGLVVVRDKITLTNRGRAVVHSCIKAGKMELDTPQ
jgi:hypothetical protein